MVVMMAMALLAQILVLNLTLGLTLSLISDHLFSCCFGNLLSLNRAGALNSLGCDFVPFD